MKNKVAALLITNGLMIFIISVFLYRVCNVDPETIIIGIAFFVLGGIVAAVATFAGSYTAGRRFAQRGDEDQ
jgi:hypothetical protein